MDIRVQQAREHHRASADSMAAAKQHQAQRNRLIRELRDEGWTYPALAKAIGCSMELIAAVVQGRVP